MKHGLQTGLINGTQAERLSDISTTYRQTMGILIFGLTKSRPKQGLGIWNSMLRKYHAALKTLKDTDAETLLIDASNDFASLSIEAAKESMQEKGGPGRLPS